MRKNEPEASQKYAEFSENYKILMKNYTRAITWRQMLNILLGIDLEKINFDFIRNLFKRKMNEEFSEEYILSKYI